MTPYPRETVGNIKGHADPTAGNMVGEEYDPTELFEKLEGVELTPDRQAIMQELLERPWFQRTDIDLQAELLTLPQEGRENHDGYLIDLADRPDNIGGVEVIRMEKLARGNFALISMFKVVNPNGEEYTYEYVSWRQGPKSGAKGVVFIRPDEDSEPTGFITLQGEKFATGDVTDDTIGGFVDLDTDGVQSILDRVHVEIPEELGIDPEDLKIDKVVNLGSVRTDAGMTNNTPEVFAAFITDEAAAKLPENPENPDSLELRSRSLIRPISELSEAIETNRDGYFQTVIARAAARGLITINPVTNED